MPIAIDLVNDSESRFHEDAERWEYTDVGDVTIVQLLDDDSHPIGVEAIAQNVCQITHLTDEEYEEVLEAYQ